MNAQEFGSVQILNSLGIDSKVINEQELTIMAILLDKIINNYNLNSYDLDIRTNNQIIFVHNDNNFIVSLEKNSFTIKIIVNGFMIGKIVREPKLISFWEQAKGEIREWSIETGEYINISAHNRLTSDIININAKSIGLTINNLHPSLVLD